MSEREIWVGRHVNPRRSGLNRSVEYWLNQSRLNPGLCSALGKQGLGLRRALNTRSRRRVQSSTPATLDDTVSSSLVENPAVAHSVSDSSLFERSSASTKVTPPLPSSNSSDPLPGSRLRRRRRGRRGSKINPTADVFERLSATVKRSTPKSPKRRRRGRRGRRGTPCMRHGQQNPFLLQPR